MTAVKPALAAAAGVALCAGCRHPLRRHDAHGCGVADCWCADSGDTTPAAPAAPAAPPSGRALDLLDPPCWECEHRRGRHVATGSAATCQACRCRNFAPKEATVASAATPTPQAEAPGPPDPAPAAPAGAVESTGEPTAAAVPVAAPKAPRRTSPRPAVEALVVPAVVGEGDADEAVTAGCGANAVTASLDRFRACPTGCGWTQKRTEFDDEPGLRAARGQHLMSHSAYEITVALEHSAAERDAAHLDPDVLFAHALFVSARWYCPACHEWPLDPGACASCRAPLQAVYFATIPREIT